MTVFRPTELMALYNIKNSDIERVKTHHVMTFSDVEWSYLLMVKHINMMYLCSGWYSHDIVMMFDDSNIQLIIANRFDEPFWYVQNIMNVMFNKMLWREYNGLDAIPSCTPYEAVVEHKKRMQHLNNRHIV